MVLATVKPGPNLVEVIPHSDQVKEALVKLSELESKTGNKQKIVLASCN